MTNENKPKYRDDPSPSRLLELIDLLRSKGSKYLVKKAIYRYFTPLCTPFTSRQFKYGNNTFIYFSSRHNNTYANERSIEIPIALHFSKQFRSNSTCEVGNVLSHYIDDVNWTIVDKYEKSLNVLNVDITEFYPSKTYEFIFSISTLEHIGFDEFPQDPHKISKTISHIKSSLLSDGGTLLVTFPLGWNQNLDRMLINNDLEFDKITYYKRTTWYNQWEQQFAFPTNPTYGTYLGADYVAITVYKKPASR